MFLCQPLRKISGCQETRRECSDWIERSANETLSEDFFEGHLEGDLVSRAGEESNHEQSARIKMKCQCLIACSVSVRATLRL